MLNINNDKTENVGVTDHILYVCYNGKLNVFFIRLSLAVNAGFMPVHIHLESGNRKCTHLLRPHNPLKSIILISASVSRSPSDNYT